MLRRALLVLLPLVTLTAPLAAQDARALSVGEALSGVLSDGDAHAFVLDLAPEQFVYAVVDQESVDVVVTVLDDEGRILTRVDGPSRGEERFTFESEAAGRYTIKVEPSDEGTGAYTILIRRAEDVATDPEARLDQLMIAYADAETPGVLVGVVEGGALTFTKAYGMANLTWAIPFDSGMRSNIGSVTKQFTAMGLLLLEQDGRLSLDDDVRTHIPELPDFGETITLRNLLNHVGGYREVYNFFGMMGYRGEDNFPRSKVIEIVQRQPDLQASPNTEFNYNNTGYILSAMTIERVSGMTFAEYMKARVFEPLGMTNTLVTSHQGQIIPNAATGYVWVEEGGWREARDLPAAAGAGGIYTTAEDMARWMLNYRDATLGGREAIDAITTNTILASGDSTGYGLGLGLAKRRGRILWTHTGGDVAHRTYFGWYPELESGVFVSSNNAGFSTGLGGAVAEAFFGDKMEPEEATSRPVAEGDMSDERKEAVVGLWQLESGLRIEVTREDGGLRAAPTGQPQRSLIPTSDSTVAVDGVEASITFHFQPDGSVARATFHQGGDNTLTRIDAVALTADELREYEGRYWSDEIEVAFELWIEDDALMAHGVRHEPISLDAGAADTFSSGIGAFEFKRAGNGRISGFMVNNGRTKDVWFTREWAPRR